METNKETMTFFSLPREIRDLIYSHLAPKEQTYSITSEKGAISIETFDNSEPDLNIMTLCKAIQYEVLEVLCRNNTFRFSFPGFDTCAKSLFHRLAPLMTHIEFYVDLGSFRRVQYHQDSKIKRIDDQAREAVRFLTSTATKCKSCRFIINNRDQTMPPPLHFQVFEYIKTLVDIDTLMIVMLQWLPDMWVLGAFLEPSLGPSTLNYEWPSVAGAKWDYGSVTFRPRRFLAKQTKYQKQL